MGSVNLWSCRNAGSLSAPLRGSTAAAAWPRIGSASTERPWRSCVSPQSASCSENSAIRPEVSGQTLRGLAVALSAALPVEEVGAKGKMTMRTLLIMAAIYSLSAPALAQTAAPRDGGKPLKQVKPPALGCKLVGTVKGTKLWAGDCVGLELRGTTPATEMQSLPERATGVIPPGQKE